MAARLRAGPAPTPKPAVAGDPWNDPSAAAPPRSGTGRLGASLHGRSTGSAAAAIAAARGPSGSGTDATAAAAGAAPGSGSDAGSAATTAERQRLRASKRELERAESSLFAAADCRAASIPAPACDGVESVAGVSLRGHNPASHKTNQDAMVMVEHAATSSLLVAVFDGHGVQGHDVSGFVARTFVTLLLRDPRFAAAGGDLCAALSDSLLAAEAAMLREPSIDASLSGSTAAAAIIRGRRLWAIGVGDSRIVIGARRRGAGTPAVVAHPVSHDHKPDLPAEKKRILAAGGRVMATRNRMAPHIVGPARVWLRDVPAPGLAMSRSLGDLVAKAAGVISTPDRYTAELGGAARVLLLASDGLWDFVPNQEAVDGAVQAATDSRRLAELDAAQTEAKGKGRDAAAEAQDAARSLMRVARARWLQRTGGSDDITIVCVLMA